MFWAVAITSHYMTIHKAVNKREKTQENLNTKGAAGRENRTKHFRESRSWPAAGKSRFPCAVPRALRKSKGGKKAYSLL